MAAYDWSRFKLRIPLDQAPSEVYRAWTTQDALENWFLREARFTTPEGSPRKPGERVQPGDRYQWRWHGYDDDVTETGTVLEMVENKKFCFVFGKAGNVVVSIEEMSGKTIIQLVQEGIPTDDESIKNFHLGCMQGWTFYLANLKSILSGGIDLRNKDVNMKEVFNS